MTSDNTTVCTCGHIIHDHEFLGKCERCKCEKGEITLTPRELGILRGYGEGKTPNQLMQELGVARGTLSAHTDRIHKKLGFETTLECVLAAVRVGLVGVKTLPKCPARIKVGDKRKKKRGPK